MEPNELIINCHECHATWLDEPGMEVKLIAVSYAEVLEQLGVDVVEEWLKTKNSKE